MAWILQQQSHATIFDPDFKAAKELTRQETLQNEAKSGREGSFLPEGLDPHWIELAVEDDTEVAAMHIEHEKALNRSRHSRAAKKTPKTNMLLYPTVAGALATERGDHQRICVGALNDDRRSGSHAVLRSPLVYIGDLLVECHSIGRCAVDALSEDILGQKKSKDFESKTFDEIE